MIVDKAPEPITATVIGTQISEGMLQPYRTLGSQGPSSIFGVYPYGVGEPCRCQEQAIAPQYGPRAQARGGVSEKDFPMALFIELHLHSSLQAS